MKQTLNFIFILLTLTTIIYAKELGYIQARDVNGFKIDYEPKTEIEISREIFGAEINESIIDEENKIITYIFKDGTRKSYKLKD